MRGLIISWYIWRKKIGHYLNFFIVIDENISFNLFLIWKKNIDSILSYGMISTPQFYAHSNTFPNIFMIARYVNIVECWYTQRTKLTAWNTRVRSTVSNSFVTSFHWPDMFRPSWLFSLCSYNGCFCFQVLINYSCYENSTGFLPYCCLCWEKSRSDGRLKKALSNVFRDIIFLK